MKILMKSLFVVTALSAINVSACVLEEEAKPIQTIKPKKVRYVKPTTAQSKEDERFKKLMKSAKQGDLEAQYSLGVILLHGLNNSIDEVKALKWFEGAAESGHGGAQYYMGLIHLKGLANLEADEEEALKWFKRSAAQGHQSSQLMVRQLTEPNSSSENNTF